MHKSIWEHSDADDSTDFEDVRASNCRYCGSVLMSCDIPDIWPSYYDEIKECHDASIIGNAEAHGDFIFESADIQDTECECLQYKQCLTCGWWVITKNVLVITKAMPWMAECGVAGVLKNLDVRDLSTPISHVKDYLLAKFDSRFIVTPKIMEETVSSVFSNLGYKAEVVGGTKDGGIDIVLNDGSGRVGVQVKRSKNSIEVEQIRAFAGALLAGNYTRGIYVTTSKYQSGAKPLTDLISSKGISIELIDAKKFFDAMKISQVQKELSFPFSKESHPKLQITSYWHACSL